MNIDLDEINTQKIFQLLDKDNDDSLTLDEFVGGFTVLVKTTLPHMILQKTGLTMAQIVPRVLQLLLCLTLVFVFLTVAFAAFTGNGDSVSSALQSTIAAFAALGARASTTEPGEKLKMKVERVIQRMLNVTGQAGTDAEIPSQRALAAAEPQVKSRLTGASLRLLDAGAVSKQVLRGPARGTTYASLEVAKSVSAMVCFLPSDVTRQEVANLRVNSSPSLPKGLTLKINAQGRWLLEGTPSICSPLRTYTLSFDRVKTKVSFAVELPVAWPARMVVESCANGSTVSPILLCPNSGVFTSLRDAKDTCQHCGALQGQYSCCRSCVTADTGLLCRECLHALSEDPATQFGVEVSNPTADKIKCVLVDGEGHPCQTKQTSLGVGVWKLGKETVTEGGVDALTIDRLADKGDIKQGFRIKVTWQPKQPTINGIQVPKSTTLRLSILVKGCG